MRAGLIGLGRVGFEFSLDMKRVQPASHFGCLKNLELNGKLEDIAVCDSSADRIMSAKNSLIPLKHSSFTSYHEMMMKFRPDLVCIATPTPSHKGIVSDIASYPCVKGIFLEKPIAESLEDAEEIIKACKDHGIILSVDYTRRWAPIYQSLKNQIQIDQTLLTIVGYHPGPLLRTGTHMIDLFLNYLGEPVSIQAIGSPIDNYLTAKNKNLDDYGINGAFTFSDNRTAWLIAGLSADYLMFELDLIFSYQRIRVLNNGVNLEYYIARPSLRYDGINELIPKAILTETDFFSPLLSGISELLDACEYHEGKINSCSGEDAYKTLQATLALHYSSGFIDGIKNRQISFNDVPKEYKVKSY